MPIHGGLQDGLDDLVAALKAAPFQGQAAPWLPPGLDQVQPAGLWWHAQPLHCGPGDQGGWGLPGPVGAEVIRDQPPRPCGRGVPHRLQELHEAGTVPSRAAQGGSQPRGRLKSAQDPHRAPPTIVRGQGRSARAARPHLAGGGLGAHRAELVKANDPPLRDWPHVGLDDTPLGSAQTASTCTWNPRCWRFQTKPSTWSHFQMVAGVTWSRWRSCRACWSRTSVHSAHGSPRLWGWVRARALTVPRVMASCWRGRPARAASAKPATPCA